MRNEKRILDLAMEETRPGAIAAMLCCRPDHVYQVIRKARLRGVDIPYFRAGPHTEKSASVPVVPQRIVVSVPMYSLLQKEAKRRGRTVHETAERLLENALLGEVHNHV